MVLTIDGTSRIDGGGCEPLLGKYWQRRHWPECNPVAAGPIRCSSIRPIATSTWPPERWPSIVRLNSFADRLNFVAVNSPLGIPPSPIIAPERDRFRQLRIDDPSQDPPPGLGANIFKDRGAIERADFARPFVQLIDPEDNDQAGFDLNPALTEVLVDTPQLMRFRFESSTRESASTRLRSGRTPSP